MARAFNTDIDAASGSSCLDDEQVVTICLERISGYGEFYSLLRHCSDPAKLRLVGVPPSDMIDSVAAAWAAAGLDVHECFRRAVSVTNDWTYDPEHGLQPNPLSTRTTPIKNRTFAEILNPQPKTTAVVNRLLDWIDRVDAAARAGAPRPPFQTLEGEAIFPDQEEKWWLTELQRKPDDAQPADEDGPPSDEEEEEEEEPVAPEDPTTDEDPMSEVEVDHRRMQDVDTLLPRHRPTCWWRHS